jgi:hypothetical protein
MAKGSHSQSATRGKYRRTTIKNFSREMSASASVSHVSFWSSGRQPPRPFFLLRPGGPSRQVFAHNPKSHITFACANSTSPPRLFMRSSPDQLLNRQGRSSACARLRVEWVMMATCAGRRRKLLFLLPAAEGLRVRRDRPDGRTTRRYYHGPSSSPRSLYNHAPYVPGRRHPSAQLKHPYSPAPLLPPPLALKRVFTPA